MASSAPSTWNTLGLGVAAVYAFLGSAALLSPSLVAGKLGFRSLVSTSQDDAAGVLAFVGARDLSFSLTIVALSRAGSYQEMGTVIQSTMLFCAVDLFVMWRNGRWLETILAAVAASGAGFVGVKLGGGLV